MTGASLTPELEGTSADPAGVPLHPGGQSLHWTLSPLFVPLPQVSWPVAGPGSLILPGHLERGSKILTQPAKQALHLPGERINTLHAWPGSVKTGAMNSDFLEVEALLGSPPRCPQSKGSCQ